MYYIIGGHMKKIVFILLLTLGVITLQACAQRRNQAPVISGYQSEVTVQLGEAFNPLEGVTATDREDGDLTDQIVVNGWEAGDENFAGVSTVTLSVTDSEGLTTQVTITVTVAGDVPNPVISGVVTNVEFFIGSGTYNPLTGVTASDTIDGDLTDQIVVLDTFDLTTPGTYSIRLRVTNSLGGRVTVPITLVVKASPVPLELTSDPITITLWHAMGQGNTMLLEKYAASFMTLYPNVTVVIAESAGNYNTLRSNMINAITAGNYPNLVQGYPDHVAEYLNGRVVLNLNPYIQSDLWGLHGDDAFEDIIESYRAENSQYDAAGTFYSLPFNKSTEVMIYNRDVFERLELTPPTTWQELMTMAPLLKAEGDRLAELRVRNDPANAGISETLMNQRIAAAQSLVRPAAYDSDGNAFITFTRQFGGAYTAFNYSTGRGQLLWNTNANTFAAMQFLKNNVSNIVLPDFWDQNYASVPFVNQQVFVTFGSSAGVRYNIPGGFNESNPTLGTTFKIGVAPVPYNADRPQDRAVIQQGTNVSILNAGTQQHQLASWLFLKHLINTENTMDWAINTGYLPVRTSAYEHETYQTFLNNPNNPIAITALAAYQQSAYFFYDPAFVGSSRARAQVGLALQRIMFGDGNIQAALDEAYTEANLGG
jgi:multiple sugar transport system substrate-binding protein